MPPPISTAVIFELVLLVKVHTRLTISPNKCHFSVEIMILLARILKQEKFSKELIWKPNLTFEKSRFILQVY